VNSCAHGRCLERTNSQSSYLAGTDGLDIGRSSHITHLNSALLDATRVAALGCDFNRSMQHLDSHYREEDVENEVSDEDLLHRD